jgi:hypothetical protein
MDPGRLGVQDSLPRLRELGATEPRVKGISIRTFFRQASPFGLLVFLILALEFKFLVAPIIFRLLQIHGLAHGYAVQNAAGNGTNGVQ